MENTNLTPESTEPVNTTDNAEQEIAAVEMTTAHGRTTAINQVPTGFFENNKLLIKGMSLGLLALLLLIPQFFVHSLITERASRKATVIRELSSKWASEQTITGPMIAVPYLQKVVTESKAVVTTKKYFYLMPENLSINGKLFPEEHRRSLFKVILYKSDLDISGNFNNVAFEKLQIPIESVMWSEAKILIGISDYKGLQENVKLNWNAETKLCEASFADVNVVQKCVSAPISINENMLKQNNTFSANLKLKGTSEILFVPVGNNTKVRITSSWKVPDFRGNTLASFNADFATKGLDATWQVLGINRDFPQYWKDAQMQLNTEAFGINLLQSMDSYAKTKRTIKYAILIIMLTFAIYFFTEIFNKKWVHAIQYVLIGFALVLFYTLLLSISEYVSFNGAYIIACIATIGLIGAYTHSVFSSKKTTGLFTGFLATIYLFVFLLVQLEDTALIVGSIGLFIILALIMYASRKVNWFQKH